MIIAAHDLVRIAAALTLGAAAGVILGYLLTRKATR